MKRPPDNAPAPAYAGSSGPIPRAGVLVIVLVIVASALLPGPAKRSLLGGFPSYLHVDKLGHLVGFAAMGFALVRSRFSRVGAWQSFALALALAAFTEFCQRFVPGRTSKLGDVLIDLAGAAAGIWLASRAVPR
ncbi:MAG TPA: VanZ family protein [Ramlibacter sp.]|jgi:VanZ family protein|nr:VanZ family protein [Ramlibacter sp.]